jgi:DNA replication and repair protein RecF
VWLARLEVSDVRCIQAAVMNPGPGVNVIHGDNGAGKTALLEAVHVLGSGRSFRTGGIRELIRWEQSSCGVRGRLVHTGGVTVVEVVRETSRASINIDKQTVKAASVLAQRLPLVVLDVGSADLVLGGPKSRRRWLDTTLFHVEPRFLELWVEYHRALRQRNAALSLCSTRDTETPFDPALAQLAESLTTARNGVFVALRQHLPELAERLLEADLMAEYSPGWTHAEGYLALLRERFAADLDLRTTALGPHRADVLLKLRKRSARLHASRGQSKLLACVMMLAHSRLIADRRGDWPIFLVDDLAAELDATARRAVLDELRATGAQVFITATAPTLLTHLEPDTLFHVERGTLHAPQPQSTRPIH